MTTVTDNTNYLCSRSPNRAQLTLIGQKAHFYDLKNGQVRSIKLTHGITASTQLCDALAKLASHECETYERNTLHTA